MNHCPFDFGAHHTISAIIGQKSIKTVCSRRVPFSTANPGEHIDCPDCRAALEDDVTETEAALAHPDCTEYMREAFDLHIRHRKEVLAL